MEQKRIEELAGELAKEKSRLESDLSSVAKKDPDSEDGWKTAAPDLGDPDVSEPDELSDKFEEYENLEEQRRALQERLHEVENALTRIANGTYGTCATCGKPIPEERLRANPAAEHDIEHS